MSIVKFNFLVFLFFTNLVYYVFPKKNRWFILLISSIIFFLLVSSWKLIFYVIGGVIVSFVGTNLIYKYKDKSIQKKIILWITLILLIGTLALLKYVNIIPMSMNVFFKLFNIESSVSTFSFMAPLGISYYTLSIVGYVFDVYRETYKPQKNIFKLALFTCYYPIMVSGPFLRYDEMESELFKAKEFDWNNIIRGFERIFYGLLKKLVIADQLAPVVKTIFSNYTVYSGQYIVIGIALYALQIYADFSGCMDIIIGASKTYGIKLPENFKSPFFSKSLPEFWRRWHITLGTWSKDYIMYPILISRPFQSLGKKCKKMFGKKIGKNIPTIFAIFILWMIIGLWHGASYKYIFAAGILPWTYLTLSIIFEKLFKLINEKFRINTNCFSFHLFQSLRTFALMCFLWIFVCSPQLRDSINVLKYIFVPGEAKLLIGLFKVPLNILVISIALITIIDYLKYKECDVMEIFHKQNTAFRWILLISILIIIIVYGAYGPRL